MLGVPTDSQPQFELGDTAEDIERRRERGERDGEEIDGAEKEGESGESGEREDRSDGRNRGQRRKGM